MKTTKEDRKELRARASWALLDAHMDNEDFDSSVTVRRVCDDLDTLEAKCAWQADLLERAVLFANRYDKDYTGLTARQWLSDLEKGPKDE
jgi:hypothetical protein